LLQESEWIEPSSDSRNICRYAIEYVDAMWRMMQQPKADDYVLATGVAHSVEEFLGAALKHVGHDWRDHYRRDPRFDRPTTITRLVGDSSRAQSRLGWPSQTALDSLVGLMVDADRKSLGKKSP
jgi:GDPmannose 4,6-dehydratase